MISPAAVTNILLFCPPRSPRIPKSKEMSFFGGSDGPNIIDQAKVEIESMTDMSVRMNEMCFKKCVVKFSEADLSVGEMTCVDRCAWKYFGMMTKLNEAAMKNHQQLMQLEAAKAQQAATFGKK
jgi:mitochondrial import inner membrane translocase subunit TIM10